MTFRIHWQCGEFEDSILITGNTIEEIQLLTESMMAERGLDAEINGMWSEEVK